MSDTLLDWQAAPCLADDLPILSDPWPRDDDGPGEWPDDGESAPARRHDAGYCGPDADAGDDEPPWWLDFDPAAEHASWLANLPEDVRADYESGPWTGSGESISAGFLHRDRDTGPSAAGFASGGALDTLVPGPLLASAATATTRDGHQQLGESELIGVLLGWQRMAAWSMARQVTALITLARRRNAQSRELGNPHLAEHLDDEVAAAMTLTGQSARRLLSVAAGLATLPDVLAALDRGEIDWAKACLFVDQLAGLDEATAQEIAARLLARAADLTSGQLRAALQRAVLAADPAAATIRQAEGRKDADVQVWAEPSGNAALAGRELPVAEAIAARKRLTALARWLKRRGAVGTMGQLRAAAYTALLSGQSPDSLLPPQPDQAGRDGGAGDCGPGDCGPGDRGPGDRGPGDRGPGDGGTGGGGAGDGVSPANEGWPALTGSIQLTMPMDTWLGLADTAGEVAGHGPIDAAACRDLAASMNPTCWCLTLTSPAGQPIAHACTRHGPAAPDTRGPQTRGQPGAVVIRWLAGQKEKLTYLATGTCDHARQSPSYTPPNALRHLIQVRQRTCTAPGCRRAAVRCDLDHTIPFDQGGITCECNLSPLCRRHHRAKQAHGWRLEQHQPGVMTWTLPHERSYTVTPEPYPV